MKTPARVALSSDGRHGFTAGFMTIHRADGSANPGRYLAYWEKQPDGWHALADKRSAAKSGDFGVTIGYEPARVNTSLTVA